MRAARRADFRRRLAARAFPTRLTQFTAPALLSCELRLDGPITVLCGANGAGKTRALHTLGRLLGCADAWLYREDAYASARILLDNVEHTLTTHGVTPAGLRATLIDTARDAMKAQEFFADLPDLDEYLEPYTWNTLEADDVRVLSQLVNRAYESVDIIEIDDPGVDVEDEIEEEEVEQPTPFPFFRVRSLGIDYSSEQMGLGELSLFHLWWHLKQAEAGSFVLIDEPEAFASPHSQNSLIDLLVHAAVTKGLAIVVSTHSTAILDAVESAWVRLLVPTPGTMTVINKPTRPELLTSLGATVEQSGAFLVEDSVAKEFALNILNTHAPELIQEFEIVSLEGAGGLISALRLPRLNQGWFHMVGLPDGDCDAMPGDCNWPHVKMPGESAPEIEFRNEMNRDINTAARLLGQSADRLRISLAATAGLDHHDWLPAVSQLLAVPAGRVVEVASRMWMEREPQTFVDFAQLLRAELGH